MTDTTRADAVIPQSNGRWKDVAKWSVGALVGVLCFLAVTFGFSKIGVLESRQHETEKKVERIDQKLDDVKAGVDRIERRLDEKR